MSLDTIFKSYDIRGVYPTEITDEIAYRVGIAAAKFFGVGKVAVGRDMRVSSQNIFNEVVRGLNECGVDVLDIGLVSTDTIYYVTGKYNMPGIMVTASHNPGPYGGLKFCKAGAVAVGSTSGLDQIKKMVAEGIAAFGDKRGEVETKDILAEYAADLHKLVDTVAMRPLKVVVDAGNGMGGAIVPAVFAGLPFQVTPMYFELDGNFPNHPANPIEPENCVDACNKVKELGADLGIIFDGDADRAFFVDDTGRVLSSSLITALVAKSILAKNPGAKVLYNVVSSKIVPETIEKYGGLPVMERVGHSFIKARMREEDILFGGEHSGHFYYRSLSFADSGIMTALVVLELLSREGKKFSDLLREFDKYFAIPETNSEVADKAAAIAKLREEYAARGGKVLQDYDGMSMDMGTWWFNVRPSGTEPLLRLNLEASTAAERDAMVAEILGKMRAA